MDTAAAPSIGYSAIEGMPAGLNGPNVIVVDTSSLKTREEEEKVCTLPADLFGVTGHLPSKIVSGEVGV